jgi:hypothetical protein
MGLGKTYSTDYLVDSNGNTGVAGQILVTTATGVSWQDAESTGDNQTQGSLFDSKIVLIDTPNGGLKTYRVITDEYGEWIQVGRFAANAMTTIQGTWSSVSGLSTGIAQSETTEFSADFGDSFPTEVRVMGATDFNNWRNTRTIDWIYKSPEGRKWKYFFSGGAENGMTQVPLVGAGTRWGWSVNGAYDGFGRWTNATLANIGMSDVNPTNPSAAYSTATANAFNWDSASDAKLTVNAYTTYSGQDEGTTSGVGSDDSTNYFFDSYPTQTINAVPGGTEFSSAVWVLIKLPGGASGSGGSGGGYWAAGGLDIYNTNAGNVGIGTDSPEDKLEVSGGSLKIKTVASATLAPSIKLGRSDQANGNFENHISSQTGSGASQCKIEFKVCDTTATGRTTLLSLDGGNNRSVFQGNVGIGTTNPGVQLEIGAANHGVVVARLTQTYEKVRLHNFDLLGYSDGHLWMIGNDSNTSIVLGASWDWDQQVEFNYTPGTSGVGAGLLTIGQTNKNNTNYTHGVTRFYTNGLERMRINSAGNVGIGTTTPGYLLDLSKTAVSVDTYSGINLQASNYGYTIEGGLTQNVGGELIFSSNNAGTRNPRVKFAANGNVGIGTTSPRDTLEIEGNMRFVEGEDHLMIKPNSNIHGADFIVGDGVAATDTPVMSLNGLYGGQVTIQTQGNTIADKTVLDVQGTQGQLFSVTDDLSGDIFSVADISGVPIMNVNSDGTSYFDGNVGIGATSPTRKLSIEGTAYLRDNLAITVTDPGTNLSKDSEIYLQSKGNQSGTVRSSQWHLRTESDSVWGNSGFSISKGYDGGSASEYVRITSGGNVGINVTNPTDARLKVLGNVIFDGYNTSDPDSTSRTAYPADQMFTHYANNGVSIIGGKGSYTGVGLTIGEETTRSSNFKFIRGVSDTNGGANAAEEFWVNGVGDAYFAGNVGIGTDSPNTPLEVTGGISTTSSDFVIASTGERLLLQTAPSPYSYSKIQATSGGGTMISEVLALQPDGGGVAIGTTSSGADKLLVNGTINFNNNGDKGFVCNPGSGTFSLGDIDDVAGGVYMDGDGVNINYYAGTAVIGAIDEYGTLTVIGDIVAYGSPSDIRLKENIKPIESALDKVIKLQGVTFDWKESDSILDIKEDIGFIAQDVQKVVPELVRENDNGMLSMRHQGITPILLEAIKELKAEIDLLKSKTCNCNNCNCSI